MVPGAANNSYGIPVKSSFSCYEGHVADFNKDGILDCGTVSSGSPNFKARLGIGDGFSLFGQLGAEVDSGVKAGQLGQKQVFTGGDFNADGNPDLVVATNKSQFGIVPGDGANSFKPGVVFAGTTSAATLRAIEVSGDNRTDLFIGGTKQTMLYRSNP